MNIEYRVKFRAFGITFGTVKGAHPLPNEVRIALTVAGITHVKLIDERGVYIALAPKPVEP